MFVFAGCKIQAELIGLVSKRAISNTLLSAINSLSKSRPYTTKTQRSEHLMCVHSFTTKALCLSFCVDRNTHTCVHTHLYFACVSVCVHVCMFVCVCVSVCACVCVCVQFGLDLSSQGDLL